MLPPRDLGRLADMTAHVRQAIALCEGLDETAFLDDVRTCLACARCCEVVGEAASQVAPETRQALHAIPWPVIIGFRNVLIHQYHRIDYRIVFRIIRKDLPGLLRQLEAILSEQEPTGR